MAASMVCSNFNIFGSRDAKLLNISHDSIMKLRTTRNLGDYFDTILQGEYQNINKTLFNNMLINLTNLDHENVGNMIISSLEKYALEQKNGLQQKLTIENILTIRSDFHARFVNLRNILWHYNKSVKNVDANNNKTNFLNLIFDFIFYKIIINANYLYMGKSMPLYEILNLQLVHSKLSYDSMMLIRKMKDDADDLQLNATKMDDFDDKLHSSLLVGLGSNQEFIKYLVELANKNFADSKFEILDIIISLKEKDLFKLYYRVLFEKRLFKTEFNIKQEEKILIELTNKLNDPEFSETIKNQISDIKNSLKMMEHLRSKVQIKVVSDKAKKEIGSKSQLDKINFIEIRPQFINNIDIIDCLPPSELEPYFVLFEKYYKLYHQDQKEIAMNYSYGTSIVEITIGNATYNIQLTTLQLFVFMQFNKKDKLTVVELEELVGITRIQLAPIINSFLRCKLIGRSEGTANDPTISFFINEDFVSEQQNLSLVNVLEEIQLANTITAKTLADKQATEEKELMNIFTIGRSSLLQAKIVHIMKQKKTVTQTELSDLIGLAVKEKDGLLFEPPVDMLKEVLQKTIDDGYIALDGDTYKYVEFVPIDSESEEFSDSDYDNSDNSDYDSDY